MSTVCSGTGECLSQTNDVNIYTKSSDYTCEHNCLPIPCDNVLVCGMQLPKWLYQCKNGLCINCDVMFGKLRIIESGECPVCLETTQSIIMPNCTHSMCVGCFKRIMYGEEGPIDPPFPYSSEVEAEWERSGCNNPEWRARYPLIEAWVRECDELEEIRQEIYEDEEGIRRCPLCRASQARIYLLSR